jgi:hypothetical protein
MTNTANQKIAARVLALIATGMNPIEALKAVCPAADVDQMISDLYDQLRARA